MKFNLKMDDPTIVKAAALVTQFYNNAGFLELVSRVEKFNMTADTGADVAKKIAESNVLMTIQPYRTWNPFSRTIGYAEGNTIWVNTRKLDLSLKSRVNNFMHEPLHLLGYSHQGNYVTDFNKGTVPYRVGEVFANYLEVLGRLK